MCIETAQLYQPKGINFVLTSYLRVMQSLHADTVEQMNAYKMSGAPFAAEIIYEAIAFELFLSYTDNKNECCWMY